MSKILFYGDHNHKYIIVSGKNYILKFLSHNLSVPFEIRKTGPVNDSILCTEPNQCVMSMCSLELKYQDKCRIKLTDVYVKSWTIADSSLVICYNVYQGYCETIDLFSDFSNSSQSHHYSIVTYDLKSHSTILYFEKKLYVAIEINSMLNFLSIDFNTISIRKLPNMDIIKYKFIFNPFYGRLGFGFKTIFPLEFKGSFHIHDKRKNFISSDYIFFLVNQPENKIDPKNGKFQTRLVRICSKDEDFSSFIDVGLYCEINDVQTYYQIDSWYLGYVSNTLSHWYRNNTRFPKLKDELEADFNQILYLNLKTIRITDNYKETLNSLTTCAFPIAEIMEVLDVIKYNCFNSEGSVNERPYDVNSNDSPCHKDDFSNRQPGYCGGIKNKHIIGDHSGINSVIGYKIINKEGFRGSSIIVFLLYEKYTIVLIGGNNGVLYKYELYENKYQEIGATKLFNDKILDLKLHDDNSTVFAVSNSKIVINDFKICDQEISCDKCLHLSPFCVWCISNGKCVVQDKCSSYQWIHYERNKEINVCPEIRNLPSHSISEYSSSVPIIHFKITKTVSTYFIANSPFLKCQYHARGLIITVVKAYYFSSNNSLSCEGPPKDAIPNIMDKDFIDFKLRILVNTSFVVESIYYVYNCAHNKNCSRCTDNQFNCSWCVLDSLCVSSHISKCTKSLKISNKKSHDCPKLQISNKTFAFHADSPINIDIFVNKYETYFTSKMVFYCFETCRNSSVRAITEHNEIPGSLRCTFENIKILKKDGNVKCLLLVNWKISNLYSGSLESDHHIEFQVFDCIKLSQHCDDCVLLPQIYQCGFCTSNKSCVQKQKCFNSDVNWINDKRQNCPFPLISEIFPENSTLSSETIVLIKGRNLGFYERDIQNMISLENNNLQINCKFIDKSYISSKQFMCKIENVTSRIETPVSFHFVFKSKTSYLAKREFNFFNPNVKSLVPNFGPFFGGTVIKVIGNYLNIGMKREFNFRYKNFIIPCQILKNYENETFCRMNAFNSKDSSIRLKRSLNSRNGTLQMAIDQNIIHFNNIIYYFHPNPNVIKISRNKLISEGGQMLKIVGNNMKLIHRPCLAFYCKNMFSISEGCGIINNDIYCITPKMTMNNSVIKSQECELSFGMENGTVSIYNTTITIFSIPIILNDRAKVNLPSTSFSFIKTKVSDDKIPIRFIMKDKMSINSFIESDINIKIGSLKCINVTFSGNNIHCEVKINQINIYRRYPVEIKIGNNLSIYLESIQFEKGDISLDTTSVIIMTVIIAITIVAIIIISVIIVKKVQRKQKVKNKKQNIFTEKVMREANEIMKLGISELNQITIQDDIHKNWNTAPIYPYNVYILYNLFPNTHPRLFNENRNTNESIIDLNYYNYNSNDPTSHPLIFNKQIQVIENTIEYSRKLSKLFEDELFVLMFFSFLEEHQEVDSKKSDIISFLSLILMKDMSNYTKILKILIKDDYDKKEADQEERSMFRQSDLLSKLLSNWFFILMYDHLQNINAGGDLLILYLNILNVINNGPVKYDTNKCQYALNENSLLERKVDYNKLTLKVKHELLENESELEIIVLDCDCIAQVKLKIFEDIYKYTPYSQWNSLDDYELVKVNHGEAPESEQLLKSIILKEIFGHIYKTLKDYEIKNGDSLALILKSGSASGSNTASVCHSLHIESNSASLKTNRSRTINKEASIVNFTSDFSKKTPTHTLTDNLADKSLSKSNLTCCRRQNSQITKNGSDIKQICLIYTQVLKSKIEQQIKNVFDDIFDYESVPHCVTDLFTHFNKICKDDSVVFAVKSNSLILRFWIQLINNIDFLFDIPLVKHTPVLECLKCISRVLMDICSENQNKDVWLTQLFSDVIKIYNPKVLNYYEGIKNTSNINFADYYSSSKIDGINISLAIVILYQNYIKSVHNQFVEEIQSSNYPKDKQNEWIFILKEVNDLYFPEPFLSDGNGDIKNMKTTFC